MASTSSDNIEILKTDNEEEIDDSNNNVEMNLDTQHNGVIETEECIGHDDEAVKVADEAKFSYVCENIEVRIRKPLVLKKTNFDRESFPRGRDSSIDLEEWVEIDVMIQSKADGSRKRGLETLAHCWTTAHLWTSDVSRSQAWMRNVALVFLQVHREMRLGHQEHARLLRAMVHEHEHRLDCQAPEMTIHDRLTRHGQQACVDGGVSIAWCIPTSRWMM